MTFKVTFEKLKKGWMMTLPMDSERQAKAFVTEIQDRDRAAGYEGKKLAKLKGVVKKNGKGKMVKIYRSKLAQASELTKEMFLRYREEKAQAA